MATTKAAGSTRLGRDSQPKYLGVKVFAGQPTKQGQILVRQRGAQFRPGKNVKKGGDDTLFALTAGIVQFTTKRRTGFDRSRKLVRIVEVIPR